MTGFILLNERQLPVFSLLGIGLCDVENKVGCSKKSVFRIASISKSVTMAIVAKLVEEGRLDLDLPVQHYVPEWPDKFFNGVKVYVCIKFLYVFQELVCINCFKYLA